MTRASAEAKEPGAEGAAELAIRAEELTSRLVGGMSRLFGQASRSAQRVKEAPDALVSPVAIATILPALKSRLARSGDEGPDDRSTLAGYLHRAVQHAVDPRNTGLHPGVALRIFEEGREINPEASRRAAEAALEPPHLHEAKRERLSEWLGGKIDEVPVPEPSAPQKPAKRESDAVRANGHGLSEEEIAKAAARLRRAKPAPRVPVEITASTERSRPREPRHARAHILL